MIFGKPVNLCSQSVCVVSQFVVVWCSHDHWSVFVVSDHQKTFFSLHSFWKWEVLNISHMLMRISCRKDMSEVHMRYSSMVCHALRDLVTTRPNRPLFPSYGRKVWTDKLKASTLVLEECVLQYADCDGMGWRWSRNLSWRISTSTPRRNAEKSLNCEPVEG